MESLNKEFATINKISEETSFGIESGEVFDKDYVYKYSGGESPGEGFNQNCGDGYIKSGGIKEYDGREVYCINNKDVIIESLHGPYARVSIINKDLTLSEEDLYLVKIDLTFGEGSDLHKAYEEAYCNARIERPFESRVAEYINLYPDPDEEIPLKELFLWHYILTESCLDGRERFVRKKKLDFNKKYSTRYVYFDLAYNFYTYKFSDSKQLEALADAYGIKLVKKEI